MVLPALLMCSSAGADNGDGLQAMVTLGQVEAAFTGASRDLVAAAELQEGLALLQEARDRQGVQLFGGAAGGLFGENDSFSGRRDYTKFDLSLGLRFPLLDRAAERDQAVLDRQTRVTESRHRMDLIRRQGLAVLRRQYLSYWRAQEKGRLVQQFLKTEDQVMSMFAQRREQGYLLAADEQEFAASFDLARRHLADYRVVQDEAVRTIGLLTRQPRTAFQAQAPELTPPLLQPDQLKAFIVDHDPGVLAAKARFEGLCRIVKISRTAGPNLNATLDVYGTAASERPQGTEELGLGVALSFRTPFKRAFGPSARHQTHLARLARAKQAFMARTETTVNEALKALGGFQAADSHIAFARRRLAAALERVRENMLRAAFWEGDTLEKLQQSRYTYLLAALDYIDAWALKLRYHITLLEYGPSARGGGLDRSSGDYQAPGRQVLGGLPAIHPPPEPFTDSAISGRGWSFYVWQSRRMLQQESQAADFWPTLEQLGVDRLLVSLDRDQIQQAAQGRMRLLSAFLSRAHARGVAVELLLGEPRWILPAHRSDLVDAIEKMGGFAFDGLHLDLEPDQLDAAHYDIVELCAQWIQTVRRAKMVSPWPVSVSLHPRYLSRTSPCPQLTAALETLRPAWVALMMYLTDQQRVVARLGDIVGRHPGLVFRLAQSVEPHLPESNSYAHWPRQRFAAQLAQIEEQAASANMAGFVIQSWRHYLEMRP